MTNNVQANQNVVMKVYGNEGPIMPIYDHQDTCLLIGLQTLTKSHKSLSNHLCNSNTSKFASTMRMLLKWRMKSNTMLVIPSGYLSTLPQRKGCWVSQSGWIFDMFFYNQCGDNVLFVSVYMPSCFNCWDFCSIGSFNQCSCQASYISLVNYANDMTIDQCA